jgi:bifunctional DNase/RNase
LHARLYVENAAGDESEIDSRTSDAIAVAVRTGSPIYADERVLDEAGVEPDGTDEEREPIDEERLAIFRDFVNSLDVDLPNYGEGGSAEES